MPRLLMQLLGGVPGINSRHLFSARESPSNSASAEKTKRCNDAKLGERDVNQPGNARKSEVEKDRAGVDHSDGEPETHKKIG